MFNESLQISWYMHVELDNASNIKIPPRRGLSQAVLYYKYSEINRPQDTVYYSLDTFPFLFKKYAAYHGQRIFELINTVIYGP